MKPIRITTSPATSERDMIAMLIATGALKVTRCPDGARERDSRIDYKHGGALPGHLDPRTIGETEEQRLQREREQLVAPDVVTSRRKRVGRR
jgi:hypothetical protein